MAEVKVIEKLNSDCLYVNTVPRISKKLRVCAYCRVSSELEDQKTSYISQIRYYTDYIKKKKEWEFAGIYADEGITGTQIKNRIEFIRMIEDCKDGKIDMIIAKSISRFARNTVDTLNTVRILRSLSIDVYFEKENIHTLNMDSEMFLTLYSAFAQAESESTSQNVKMGYKAKMKRGEACGFIGCYGYIYDKNSKELMINENEAKIVKKIFKYYINGYGSTRLARMLQEEAIPSPTGGVTWHPSVIKSILTNVKYVGDICGQKYFVEDPITHKLSRNRGQLPKYYAENHHIGIIDRQTFDKAQSIYQARSIKLKDGKVYCEKYSLRYTFSSIIYCQHCGNTFVRRCSKYKNKDGVIHNHIYWACSSNLLNKKGNCGMATTIREEEIKSLFVALYNKFLNHSKNDDLINKLKNIIFQENSDDKIKLVDKKIDNVKAKIGKLLDLNINSIVDNDVFNLKNQELNEELNQLIKEKNAIINSKKFVHKEEERLRKIQNELAQSSTITSFDDEIFKKLVKRIIIGDYDENRNYDPYVVKFVLDLHKNNSDNTKKFLSLELDERVP